MVGCSVWCGSQADGVASASLENGAFLLCIYDVYVPGHAQMSTPVPFWSTPFAIYLRTTNPTPTKGNKKGDKGRQDTRQGGHTIQQRQTRRSTMGDKGRQDPREGGHTIQHQGRHLKKALRAIQPFYPPLGKVLDWLAISEMSMPKWKCRCQSYHTALLELQKNSDLYSLSGASTLWFLLRQASTEDEANKSKIFEGLHIDLLVCRNVGPAKLMWGPVSFGRTPHYPHWHCSRLTLGMEENNLRNELGHGTCHSNRLPQGRPWIRLSQGNRPPAQSQPMPNMMAKSSKPQSLRHGLAPWDNRCDGTKSTQVHHASSPNWQILRMWHWDQQTIPANHAQFSTGTFCIFLQCQAKLYTVIIVCKSAVQGLARNQLTWPILTLPLSWRSVEKPSWKFTEMFAKCAILAHVWKLV